MRLSVPPRCRKTHWGRSTYRTTHWGPETDRTTHWDFFSRSEEPGVLAELPVGDRAGEAGQFGALEGGEEFDEAGAEARDQNLVVFQCIQGRGEGRGQGVAFACQRGCQVVLDAVEASGEYRGDRQVEVGRAVAAA